MGALQLRVILVTTGVRALGLGWLALLLGLGVVDNARRLPLGLQALFRANLVGLLLSLDAELCANVIRNNSK